ncbi:hypothetical protein ABZP36_026346 [Zizania latifolia]
MERMLRLVTVMVLQKQVRTMFVMILKTTRKSRHQRRLFVVIDGREFLVVHHSSDEKPTFGCIK